MNSKTKSVATSLHSPAVSFIVLIVLTANKKACLSEIIWFLVPIFDSRSWGRHGIARLCQEHYDSWPQMINFTPDACSWFFHSSVWNWGFWSTKIPLWNAMCDNTQISWTTSRTMGMFSYDRMHAASSLVSRSITCKKDFPLSCIKQFMETTRLNTKSSSGRYKRKPRSALASRKHTLQTARILSKSTSVSGEISFGKACFST